MGAEIGSTEIRWTECPSKGDAVLSGINIGAIHRWESVDNIGHGV